MNEEHTAGHERLTVLLDRLLDPVEDLIATLGSEGRHGDDAHVRAPSVLRRGENVLATIAIPEDLARQGGRTLVRFSVLGKCAQCEGTGLASGQTGSCAACAGRGRREVDRTLNVAFPAGVTDGDELRVGGEGNESHNGGPAGDLVLSVMLVRKGRLSRGRLRRSR